MHFTKRVCIMAALTFCLWFTYEIQTLIVMPQRLQNEIRTQLLKQLVPKADLEAELNQRNQSVSRCGIPRSVWKECINDIMADFPHSACSLEELAQNCTLLSELHGYDKPVNQLELDFPLAFGIKMHISPEQAEQLLRTIYRPHNVYCIHIDKKSDDVVYRVMSAVASCFPNVILTERISFVYGGYDSVRAELNAMACALNSSVNWKYYINLAGEDFPLRTNLEMVHILGLLNGTNDIESFPVPTENMDRISFKYKAENGKMVNTKITKEPPTFRAPVRKGSQYNAFSRGFVSAIFNDDVAKDVRNYFNDTVASDEHIWSTINALPWIPGGYPFYIRHTPTNEHISRAVAWENGDSYQCKGEYVHEVCIFGRADLPWLLLQPNLFANKFRWEKDSRPSACLEAVVNQRARTQRVMLDHTYYGSLRHVKFRNQKLDFMDIDSA